jgi:hypothetical protein
MINKVIITTTKNLVTIRWILKGNRSNGLGFSYTSTSDQNSQNLTFDISSTLPPQKEASYQNK